VTEIEAVQAAARRCPDLITSDVRLAVGCGIAAVQAICNCRNIPVLFITATAADLDDRLPGSAVLGKPFTLDELGSALMAVGRTAFDPVE
jgi:CheY-like chemotaxis protein